jgi:hypothetical protein
MKCERMLAVLALAFCLSTAASGQKQGPFPAYWTTLTPPAGYQIGPVWLLTDGSVLALAAPANCPPPPYLCYPTEVFRLVPDLAGSYTTGSWVYLISMPSDYGPTGFASAVLANGKVIMEGGEENQGVQNWTTKGYLLDPNPTSPSWSPIMPPGWPKIGDAPGVVLNDGTFLLGDCCESPPPAPELMAKFVPTSLALQTVMTSGKLDSNNEEGWTLLPYQPNTPTTSTFLTVDTNRQGSTSFEIYNSTTQQWTNGTVGFQLYGHGNEIGPQVLRADGTVFAVGASDGIHSGHTGIYTPGNPGTWAPGPDLPTEQIQGNTCVVDGGDTGAALLTSGNVLLEVHTLGSTSCPLESFFFEYDGTNLNATPATSEVTGAMLVLPTGQVLLTDAINARANPVVYTPAGYLQPPQGGPWAPIVTNISSTSFTRGQQNIQISGWQFNGMSQANMFGDDLQDASNYPLVRLTLAGNNGPSFQVTYCKTHDHSSMAVATKMNLSVTTLFDIPQSIAAGSYYLEVVANGISSGYYGPYPVN